MLVLYPCQCPHTGAWAGAYSVHDNAHEDRRWSFRCCSHDRWHQHLMFTFDIIAVSFLSPSWPAWCSSQVGDDSKRFGLWYSHSLWIWLTTHAAIFCWFSYRSFKLKIKRWTVTSRWLEGSCYSAKDEQFLQTLHLITMDFGYPHGATPTAESANWYLKLFKFSGHHTNWGSPLKFGAAYLYVIFFDCEFSEIFLK
jgi:hypothetical protein